MVTNSSSQNQGPVLELGELTGSSHSSKHFATTSFSDTDPSTTQSVVTRSTKTETSPASTPTSPPSLGALNSSPSLGAFNSNPSQAKASSETPSVIQSVPVSSSTTSSVVRPTSLPNINSSSHSTHLPLGSTSVPTVSSVTAELEPLATRPLAPYVSNQLILKFKQGITTAQIAQFQSLFGAVSTRTIKLTGAQVWKLSGSLSVEKILAQYRSNSIFEYIEPDYIRTVGAITPKATFPNDPSFNQLWGLHNTGQNGGVVDADIDAPEAWDIQKGNPNLVIGVIDTGVDYNHPDLVDNIWTNSGEIAGDGIDNDSNGYIDDIRGWDFAYNDNNPSDVDGHGTHVSGTIAGKGNNGVGVTGVAWNAKIMPLKFLNDQGSGSTSNAILAIDYATAKGVKLTNNSWGGGGFSQALYDSINAAGQQGALFIAAAGNDGTNNDVSPHYPSNYDLANVVSVAATNRNDQLVTLSNTGGWWGSNYGLTTVDLAAPGHEIYSTTPGNTYSTFSGTSMATPHVTGAVALLWSQNPTWTAQQVKNTLMNTGDSLTSLAGKTVSGKRLNVFNALAAANLPSVTVSVSPTSVQEDGATNLVYTFTRSNLNLSSPLTVNFGVNGTANAAPVGSDPTDYTVLTNGSVTFNPTTKLGTVTFAAGATTATVVVDPIADTIAEIANETVALAVNGGTGYIGGSPGTATGTIISEEALPIFSNPNLITIPSSGSSTPYPSTINVSGLSGNINSLKVTLTNLSHTWPDDIDVLLVGPTGAKALLMSDVGGSSGVNSITLTFDPTAASFLPDSGLITSGSYKPTDIGTGDLFNSPAPGGPYGTDFSVFNNTSPNGTWSLYVVDDAGGDAGTIAGGWSLTIGTASTTTPTLAIAATNANQTEGNSGSKAFTFTVTRAVNTTGANNVNWAVTGSGTANATDFVGGVLPTGTVSFAAGETSKVITVNVQGDTTVEPNENFTVTLSNPTNGATITTATAVGTIQNDDNPPTITLDADGNGVAQGATDGILVARYLFGFTGTTLTNGAIGSGATRTTATDIQNYLQNGLTTMLDADGNGVAQGATDGILIARYLFGFTGTTLTNGAIGTGATRTTAAQIQSFLATYLPTSSGSKVATTLPTQNITATPSSSTVVPGGVVSVKANYSTSDNNTTLQSSFGFKLHYSSSKLNFVNFANPGVFSTGVAPTIGTPEADTLNEDNDTTTDKVINVAWLNFGGVPWPNVAFPVTLYNANFTAASTFTTGTTKVNFSSQNTSPGYTFQGTSAVITAGTTTVPTLAITATNANQTEGNSGSKAFTFTVTRAVNTTGANNVNWAVGSGTANATDFVGGVLPSGVVSFAAGETSKVITVNVQGDTTVEPNENFTVTLSNPTNGATITTATAIGTIQNDDPVAGPTQNITATPSSSTVVPGGAVSVKANYSTSDNNTTLQSSFGFKLHYSSSKLNFVNFANPGVFSTGVAPTIGTPEADTLNEDNDTTTDKVINVAWLNFGGVPWPNVAFPVTLYNANFTAASTFTTGTTKVNFSSTNTSPGYTFQGTSAVITAGTTTVPTLAIAATNANQTEGNSGSKAFTFTVTRAVITTGANNVNWAVTGSGTSAANATDFVGGVLPSGVVSFAAGETSKVITVNVQGDTTVEPNENFTVTLSNPTNGATITTATAIGTIQNDDGGTSANVTLASNYSGVSENGKTNLIYNFTRSGATTSPLTVNFVLGGTAARNSDYSAYGANFSTATTGNVTFAVGVTTAQVIVVTTGDTTKEANETVAFTLASGTGYTIGTPATVTTTILNDDGVINQQGTTGNDAIEAGTTRNLSGRAGHDILIGSNTSDMLVGGAGNDTITSSAGFDTIAYSLASEGGDTITDFNVFQDTLQVSAAGFGGGLIAGESIAATQFVLGTVATTASHRFIFNKPTGQLFFDVDGNGSGVATLLANLTPNLNLTEDNIFAA